MRQLNSFGPRGGSRGEQHHRDIVGVGELGNRLGPAGGGDELGGLDARRTQTRDHVGIFGVKHHQRFGQAIDQLGQGLAGESVIERSERPGGPRRGEDQQRKHQPAGAHVHHAARTGFGDDPRTAVGEGVELPHGEPLVIGDHPEALGVGRRHLQEQCHTHRSTPTPD